MKSRRRSRVLYWNFISEMANKYNLDYRIVEAICFSPFRFVKDTMSNDDLKPIMLAYFGKFKLKRQFENDKNVLWK